ncbi:MAG: hypothetical protein OEN56_04350 [Gemmatimonadota bacterium]|nr:hypothetical protein [Gemmatimonadota bacterium]
MQERARRVDDRRVSDLKGIAAATNLYWTRHAALPASIADLTSEPGVRIVTLDPARLVPYEYRPLDSLRYELCAVFERESGATSLDPDTNLWAHGSGRHCFRLDGERTPTDGR